MSEAQPHATWQQWLSDAAGAAADVTDGLSDWGAFSILGACAAGIALVARVGRHIPGWGSAIAWGADMVSGWVAPDGKAKTKKRAETLEESAWEIMEAIEELPADAPIVGDLKKRISENTPPEFNAIFDEWKKSRGKH